MLLRHVWRSLECLITMVENQIVQEIFGCVDLANFEAGFFVILKLWGELTSWPNHAMNNWFFKRFYLDKDKLSPMVIAEFQVGLALKGFASKQTVPNYRVKWGADFSPPKWMFCPKASAKHAQTWFFLGSNSLLGIHLSQQLKNFKIFYHLQSLREPFMESICPKIGGLTVP